MYFLGVVASSEVSAAVVSALDLSVKMEHSMLLRVRMHLFKVTVVHSPPIQIPLDQ